MVFDRPGLRIQNPDISESLYNFSHACWLAYGSRMGALAARDIRSVLVLAMDGPLAMSRDMDVVMGLA